MADLQAAKRLVLKANAALDVAGVDEVAAALSPFVSDDYRWRGMHPFHEMSGLSEVANRFWSPLKVAMGPMQRRADMFLAGMNQLDDWSSLWVVEMGHLMALWDNPWLGFAPSRKLGFLRYAEFHRIENGLIVETANYVDILNFLSQAGYRTVPDLTGVELLSPGPKTHDGLLFNEQEPAEGLRTVELISAMVTDLRENTICSPGNHIDQFWTDDMSWFGPGGIGASGFKHGYRRGHAGPFEQGLEYVHHTEHVARIGEGMFGGFFGYPSLTMKSKGYLGLPPSDTPADMRIVDLYRREGDKLAENWIFIDIPHFLAMQGVDILAELGREG
ncbi:MAG: nuclear transport factor 2 family protein [Pseudomonadota bacterium]